MLICTALLSVLAPTIVLAGPTRRSSPAVTLDGATFTGLSSGEVNKFLGIPYAQPPIDDLRFRQPQPIAPYNAGDSISATSFGFSCPQQTGGNTPNIAALPNATISFILGSLGSSTTTAANESCLTLNVVAPANATSSSKLPVVIWIYGGGFETGSSSATDGGPVVERSLALNEPIVYVSMNYRLSAFGFLAGKEVKEAQVGNLGLQDQREAMRWVQKYITAFGGDPTKVTIWGESAGAISVGFHMVANKGNNEGLFRGAFMESGSPLPVGDITNGQPHFDAIASETGCSTAADKLECLRTVPYANLTAAMNTSPGQFGYGSLAALAWLPRVDGIFITENPQVLIAAGKVAAVPMINGDVDDEGTLFSLSTLNITTTAQLKQYIQASWFPQASAASVNGILALYPDNPALGSPFNTGANNSLAAQYKRIAAFQGDAVFQAPRRYFLNARSGKQKTWSYLYKRYKDLPALGSVHSSDSYEIYAGGALADYLINFVANLDPSGSTNIPWPQYTTWAPNMLTFYDNPDSLNITQDTYRQAPIAYLIALSLVHPIW
ncbi:carotenoid ester lipase precursor [Athelia psychrophila]|uniref:Carboxylic ester hydrolase n=1 Tax=Athelia psychrophila TaxID=1759441 RepID=A0A166CRL5_9AGAM|nr:carotenoid ester lipase precursor [Fibularhizoctonia sp. CBS 109695]